MTLFTKAQTGLMLSTAAALTAAAPTGAQTAQTDLFSFAAGGRLVSVPEDSDMAQMAWSPLNLIDGSAETDWVGKAGEAVFVLELAETTRLSRIAFDTTAYVGRKSVKDFTVEVSESSPRAGFHAVMRGTLQMTRANQSYAFKPEERPVARWVRLTLHSNYGGDNQSFTGFRGYGEQLTHDAALTGLTGNYDGASGWGWIHLVQSGDRVSGCYEFQSGAFDGVVEGRVMRILMRADDGGREVGLFQFSPDGRKLVGLVRGDDAASRDVYASYYSAEKTGNHAGGC
jgi:hypothetical protein